MTGHVRRVIAALSTVVFLAVPALAGATVNGFTSEGIPRGPVVGTDVFRTVGDGFDPEALQAGLPFLGFPLFTLDISGADLAFALEATLGAGIDDVFVQVSGMRYAYDSREPAGARVTAITVEGRPLNPNRVYSATVNLGVVQGLPQLGVKVSNVKPTGDNEYLAVRDWARHLRVLLYASEGRIVDVGTPCR